MREAGEPSTRGVVTVLSEVCSPTGGSHGRTDEGPTQRFEGAKRRAAPGRGPRKRGRGQYRGRSPVGFRSRALRGAAVGATPPRLPPQRLSLCGPSLTSSPGRVPPPGMVTERTEFRRLRPSEGRAKEGKLGSAANNSIKAGVLHGSGPASLAYLEFVVVLSATYRLYILVSRIR
jgi:hypothetical protein